MCNVDYTGTHIERGWGGGGGFAYAGGYAGSPTTPQKQAPIIIPIIPFSTTYDIETLRAEKFAVYKYLKNQAAEKMEIATITRPGKKVVFFPENPLEFTPLFLIPVSRDGSYNGSFITWMLQLHRHSCACQKKRR